MGFNIEQMRADGMSEKEIIEALFKYYGIFGRISSCGCCEGPWVVIQHGKHELRHDGSIHFERPV